MLQGISQSAAQTNRRLDMTLNPLNNFYFTAASSVLIIGLGWLVTERLVEPRLAAANLSTEISRNSPA